jgi:DNA-binding MarR family transcriptional regulator
MKKTAATQIDLETLPGHYIRRLQQIAVAIFLQETSPTGVTPVQYAALQAVANTPGIDQRTLARNASPDDRRVRLLTLTDKGHELLESVVPAMLRAQARMLEPLPKRERAEFMRMLRELVQANNELSRAPSEAG